MNTNRVEEPSPKRPRLLASFPPTVFRLEFRHGANEFRFLVFAPQRPGVIAKIVFTESKESLFTITCLECKPEYRKCGMGSVLITATLDRIKQLLDDDDDDDASSAGSVQLDAEENEQRHGKLVQFYASFGFQVKPGAKISYLNNNCSEVYRKVPMKFQLGDKSPDKLCSSEDGKFLFSPVVLRTRESNACTEGILHWLDEECAVFQTARGSHLVPGSSEKDPRCFRIQLKETVASILSVGTGDFLVLDHDSNFSCRSSASGYWKVNIDARLMSLTFCSLRYTCFCTAEAVRREELPDWLQLVALLYHRPDRAQLVETLGPNIPEHGLAMLLVENNEEEYPEEVADCGAVLKEFHDDDTVDCDYLWKTHYSHLCAKYGVQEGALEW